MASQDQVRFQEQLNELVRDGKLSMSEYTRIQGDLNKMTNDQINATRTLVSELARTNKEQQKRAKIEQTIKDLESDQLDLANKLEKATQGNIKQLQGVHAEAKDITNQYIKTLDQAVKNGQLSKKQAADLKSQAIETAKIAKNMDRIASSGMAEAFDAAQQASGEIANGIESAISSLPGGNMLFNMLGGPGLQKQLSSGVTAGFSAVGKAIQGGATGVQAMTAGMTAFNAVAAINPILAVVAAIALAVKFLKGAVDAAREFAENSEQLSKDLGVSYVHAERLNREIIEASKNGAKILPDEMRSVMVGLNKELGTAAAYSQELATDIALGAAAFGASLDTATQITGQFMKMGMSATDAGTELNELMIEANASGLDVNSVMEDVASASKSVRHYFKGSVKELAKAAIKAAKMGTTLESTVESMRGMDDIGSVFEGQMTATLLDPQMLAVDFEGIMSAGINRQGERFNELIVQGFSNYETMDPRAFEEAAQAVGKTTEEIMNMVDTSKLMDKLGDGITEDMVKNAEAMGLTREQMEKMEVDELRDAVVRENEKRLEALALEEARAQSMGKMIDLGGQLVDALTSPAMQGFYNGISMVSGLLATMFMPIITSIQNALAPIKTAFSSIAESLGLAGGAGGTLEMIFNTIGAVLGLIIDYSIEPMRVIIDEIASKLAAVRQVIGGIGKLFSGDIMGGLKDIGAGIINFFTTPIEVLINTVQRFYDRAVKFINDVFGFDIPSFDELFPGLRDFFSNLGDNVMAGLTMAGEYFMNLPGNFIDKIRQGFKDIVAYLKEKISGIVQKVKDAVNPGKALKKVGSGIKKFFGFADGGIVTGPTAAMIGEAGDTEAVLPLGKFESIFGPILKKMEPGGDKFEKLAAQITGMGANFTSVSQAVISLASATKSTISQVMTSMKAMTSLVTSLITGSMQRIDAIVARITEMTSLTKSLIIGSMQRIDIIVAQITEATTLVKSLILGSMQRIDAVVAQIKMMVSAAMAFQSIQRAYARGEYTQMMAMHASLGSIHAQMSSVLTRMEKAAIRMQIFAPGMMMFRSFSSRRRPRQRDENRASLSDVVSAINRLHVAIESIDLDVKMDGTRVAEMVHVHNTFRKRL